MGRQVDDFKKCRRLELRKKSVKNNEVERKKNWEFVEGYRGREGRGGERERERDR